MLFFQIVIDNGPRFEILYKTKNRMCVTGALKPGVVNDRNQINL